MNPSDRFMEWVAEYDSAAEWCAARGIKGEYGDPLPQMLSAVVLEQINADLESFAARVREMAYWVARAKASAE